MAGYSKRPLAQKLGIKEGMRLTLIDPPDGYREGTLGELPSGVTVASTLRGRHKDAIQVFVTEEAKLRRRMPALVRSLEVDGMLWVSWPKKTCGIASDLDGNVVRKLGLEFGIVDIKVCAIDDRWSGLKFVFRTADRPAIAAARASGKD